MKKCGIEKTDVFLFDRDIILCGKDMYYEKNKFMEDLLEVCYNAKRKRIKKEINDKKTIYNITMDEILVRIHIPKKYEEQNRLELEQLENMSRVLKIRQLKITALALSTVVGVSALAYEPVKEKANEIKEFVEEYLDVKNLNDDILIHAGHCIVDGEKVNAHYGHNCVFVDDKTIPVQDRIKLYCEEHNLKYLEEEAVQKYELLNNDQIDAANEINLQELRKENKEKIKSNLR